MGSNVDYLISCIKREIPIEILNYTFCPPSLLGQIQYSLDKMIQNEIIENWLLRDCNMMGGREVTIDLSASAIREVENGFIYFVPQSITAGRNITSVLSIAYAKGGYTAQTSSNEIVNAFMGGFQSTDARTQLVAENTIFVEGLVTGAQIYARVVLDNDVEFGNISPRAMPLLAEMAVYATKAFIYTNRIIRVEEAAVKSGVTLGKFSEIIQEYADSSTLYKELRNTKWKKVNLMQDRVSMNRLIRAQVPKV